MFEWVLSYKALKVVSNYEIFILVSYLVYNKIVFCYSCAVIREFSSY